METANFMARRRFQYFKVRLSERYGSLLPHQKAYGNAVFFFVLYFLLKPLDWALVQGFLALALFSWAIAVASDLLNFYKRFAETTLGKLVLVILIGVGTNAAIAMAAQVVNELVGIDPARFPHTIAFVSTYMATVLVLVALSVLFFLAMGLVLPYLVLNWTNDERTLAMLFPWYRPGERVPYKRITVTLQFISFLVLCGLAFSWVTGEQPRYLNFVKSSAEWFLYEIEMYRKSPCPLRAEQRVAFLDNGRILLASKEGDAIIFRVQVCGAEG